MADNKVRTKMRKNRLTIDDKYMGPEPVFQPGETKDNERRENLWSKAAHWYNYFYKAKDYVPPRKLTGTVSGTFTGTAGGDAPPPNPVTNPLAEIPGYYDSSSSPLYSDPIN